MRSWFLYLLLAILLVPQVVSAEETLARQQYESGLAAFRRGDYDRAIKEWNSAYQLSKKPRFQYIIAEAYERLGEIEKAIDALERFLDIADPNDLSRSDAVALLAAWKQRLSATGIVIKEAPDSASIVVDGENWGFTPRPDKIPVKPGSHTVVVEKDGFKRFRSTVMVPAGEVAEVFAELEAETAPSQTRPFEEEGKARNTETDQTKQYPSVPDRGDSIDGDSSATVLYVISGVLAAGTVGSTIWMIDRIKGEDLCSNPDAGTTCDNMDAISTEKIFAITTTAVLGTATLAVLVAAILTGTSQSEEPNQTALCTPRSLSFATCTFRF